LFVNSLADASDALRMQTPTKIPLGHLTHQSKGQITVSPEYSKLLRTNGLDGFEPIMALANGKTMRSVPGRSTVQIQLNCPDGSTITGYLKRYERHYLPGFKKFLRWIKWPGSDDEALHEWRAIRELEASGLRAPTPIAFGQERLFGIVTRSFLLTAEIEGGVAAHDYTRTLSARERRVLVLQIADLARRFFAAGFAHRDFYLSHIFVVNQPSPGARQLFLIDLQRLFRPRLLRHRWLVKDLAALGYTAQLAGATATDLMAFYLRCFGRERLNPVDKALIRKVMTRVQSLHSRAPKYDVIWDQPGVRPPNV
jgi:hypothetical protein